MASSSQIKIPVCFDVPEYGPPADAHSQSNSNKSHQLHGADDLITLFNLGGLWDRSVKPYSNSNKKQKENGVKDNTEEGGEEKGKVMEKTYVDYVHDLPGKVRPAKRTVSRLNTSIANANATGQIPPPIPEEITGRTTMRDIVFRPETTVQRVGPFDEDLLRAAFTVEAGNVPNIDLSLLESDEIEKQSPSKKKKKRRHAQNPTDETAVKRSKLNNFAGGMAKSGPGR
jgi:hypothetical protein